VNFLAHLILSGDQPDWIIGGFLGDFVKGSLKGNFPSKIEDGIRLHRKIDRFTDFHPRIKRCQALFPADLRRFSGIIVDISFDHFLAKHWRNFDERELSVFNQEMLRTLNHESLALPANARLFLDRMASHDILLRYAKPEAIPLILKRTGQRLSRPTPLIESGDQFIKQYDQLELAFFEFFPELETFAREQREILAQQ